jgi:hypothetical protein
MSPNRDQANTRDVEPPTRGATRSEEFRPRHERKGSGFAMKAGKPEFPLTFSNSTERCLITEIQSLKRIPCKCIGHGPKTERIEGPPSFQL